MNFGMSEEHSLLKQATRRFVERELLPFEGDPVALRAPNPAILARLGELGYYGLTIPEQFGGQGLDALGYVLVMEELARAPKPLIQEVILNNGIAMLPILVDGTDEQRQSYLPRLATGEIYGAFALTEPGAGSDAAGISTFAERDGDDWIINGMKHFITLGHKSAYVCVFARTDKTASVDDGITGFIVERGTPGFEVSRMQETMAGEPTVQAELTFSDCRVPADNVIGTVGHGFRTVRKTLTLGRLQMAAFSLGSAQRLLELSLDYAQLRSQFNKPLSAFQATRFKLADMATELHAARWLTYQAAWLYDSQESAHLEAAMAKLYATEMLGRVADMAVQIHGGMGYMADLPVERMFREARLLRIVEGTSEIQRLIISSELLRRSGV